MLILLEIHSFIGDQLKNEISYYRSCVIQSKIEIPTRQNQQMALGGLCSAAAVAVAVVVRPPSPPSRADGGTSRSIHGGRIPSLGASPCRIRNGSVRCTGSFGDSDRTAYEGIYGPWTVDSSDVREVILYRAGLVTTAASFMAAASTAFLPDTSSLSAALKQSLDLFCVLGSGGLGLSLLLIHIYVSEIKRTLQALWGLGVLGSAATYIALAHPANKNLVRYVVENPSSVWLVGPLFAALTGLVFKEGLCYGKLEAGILTFVIPVLLLGHMTGLVDDGAKLILLASWMALFVIFAGRKFTQPIKDDIGDKSVFMFNSLQEDEKKALIEKLQLRKIQ